MTHENKGTKRINFNIVLLDVVFTILGPGDYEGNVKDLAVLTAAKENMSTDGSYGGINQGIRRMGHQIQEKLIRLGKAISE